MTNQALGIQPQLSDLCERLQTFQTVSATSELRQRSHVSRSQYSGSIIRIPTTVDRQQVCHRFCICRCHQKTTLASPSWTQRLIGALFIGYTSIPTPMAIHPACDEKRCIQRQNWSITVNYYFPSWLLKRAILLRSRSSPTDGCMISVRTPRVVSATAAQFLLSRQGNVAEMKKLFSQGLASPFDIESDGTLSCLQVCYNYRFDKAMLTQCF